MRLSSSSPSTAVLSAAVYLVSGVRAALSTTGTTVFLNDVAYYIPPLPVATLPFPKTLASGSGFVPITVLQTTGTVAAADVSTLVANFTTQDDVYQSGFLEYSFVQQVGSTNKTSSSSSSSGNCTIIPVVASSALIPTGPYFMAPSGALHQAYRLYADTQGAFTETVIEALDGSYSVLPAGIAGQARAVAVPSRLYFTATTAKPLAGTCIPFQPSTLYTNGSRCPPRGQRYL
jgi:hypothetical protein